MPSLWGGKMSTCEWTEGRKSSQSDQFMCSHGGPSNEGRLVCCNVDTLKLSKVKTSRHDDHQTENRAVKVVRLKRACQVFIEIRYTDKLWITGRPSWVLGKMVSHDVESNEMGLLSEQVRIN